MSGSISLDLSRDVRAGDPSYVLDVGSVLGRTFSVWGSNFVSFFLVGLVVNSPVLLGLAAIQLSGTPMPVAQKALDLASNVLTLVLTGGVTYGVFQGLRGERAGAGEVLRLGLSRLGTVWGTAILTGIGTALGLCALIVPGLVLLARWWVAVPVAVIETPGASAAISRSTELTEGNRWRVLAVAVVMGTGVFMVTVFAAAILGFVDGTIQAAGSGQEGLAAWSQLLLELVLIPVQGLAATAPAIVYHDLRVGKEGADVEDLLRVFE